MFFKSFASCRHEESRDSGSRRGFSLLELMIVVAITMTVMAFAVPKFLTAYYTVRLKAACADLSGLMQKGRIQAARENATFQIVYTTGSPQTAFVDMNNDQTQNTATVNGVTTTEPVIYFAPSITMATGAPSGSGAPACLRAGRRFLKYELRQCDHPGVVNSRLALCLCGPIVRNSCGRIFCLLRPGPAPHGHWLGSGGGDQDRQDESRNLEWSGMAMMRPRKQNSMSRQQGGMTLIELMIAMLVLAVGIMASMGLIVRAIGGDGWSKQLSNSTVLAQMVTERIMAVPAATTPNPPLTITDCAGNVATVSTSTGGATLLSTGEVDYAQAAVANYQMSYTDCDTNGRQATYDIRWNVQAIANSLGYVKLLTVSSRLKNAGKSAVVFAPEATVRTIVGQGT